VARAGQVIDNPPMRTRAVFRRTAVETGGEVLELDIFVASGATIARPHLHPGQDERLEVIAGRIRGEIRGVKRVAVQGDVVEVPRGAPHFWENDGDGEAHLVVQFRPALNTETMFQTVFGLASDGKAGRNGLPRPLQQAVMLEAYPGEMCPAGVPKIVLKLFVAVCAPIGRLLGYRPQYAKYSNVPIDAPAPTTVTPR
jgi:quercetin dioxygenase-like cupin family protein